MRWPLTREGQARFVRELTEVIRATPDGRGIGFVWWYPEAIPVAGRRIWRGGAEALFDETGQTLPAMTALADVLRETRR
jgi:arabinogalactan endo-1,4-beta-galactosidase